MILKPIKSAAARAGKRAAWSVGGILFAAVGLGFMTAALWLVLLTVVTPLYACVVLGLIYLGLGCISFAAAAMTGKPHDVDVYKTAEAPKTGVNAPPLVEAFLYGLQAGSDASHHNRRH